MSLKKAAKKMIFTNTPYPTYDITAYCSCDICVLTRAEEEVKKEEGTTMTPFVAERSKLADAIWNVTEKVKDAARQKYMLTDPDVPKSPNAIIEAIKAGNITLPEKPDSEYEYGWDIWRGIKFTKDFKPDRPGYDKYMEGYKTERDSLSLEVAILEPKEALSKFQSFERKWVS